MKKEIYILIFALLLTTALVHAADEGAPADASEALAKEFNISKDKIPTTPEGLAELKERYLKQQWEETISKNRVLGPIHNFFKKISVVFQILFAHPYEISLILFLTIILWFFLAVQASKIIESLDFVKSGIAFLMGLIVAIILAQIKFINLIVTFVLSISIKQESWWIRTIIIVIGLGFLAVIHVVSKMLTKYIQEKDKKKKEQKLEEKVKEVETITSHAVDRGGDVGGIVSSD